MSVEVESFDNDEYYKITITPSEEEEYYVVETTLGTAIINEYGEMYAINTDEWYQVREDDTFQSKKKVDKITTLILPKNETIEKQYNGKACFFITIKWSGYDFTISPIYYRIFTKKMLGERAMESLIKGTFVVLKDDSGYNMVISTNNVSLLSFVKGIELAETFKTFGEEDE